MPALPESIGAILALGAVHGINPAMGWLFAVSLGLQARSGRAVWRALGPLALGHALAVAVVLVAATALGAVVPPQWLRWIAAGALLAFGLSHLVQHRHPGARRGGMTVGAWDLLAWSFIVSSAHGAGLMVLPFVLIPADVGLPHAHGSHAVADVTASSVGGPLGGLPAALLHTIAYLGVAGGVAWVVYYHLGVGMLRSAWINVNAIWAIALIATALATALG